MNLISLSIKRPSFIIVIFTIITLSGLLSVSLLPYELLPKFSPGNIVITAVYPGAAPMEVETSITKPIEDIISGVKNVDKMWANSFENFCLIRLELAQGVDVDEIENIIQKKITTNLNQFPEEMEPPSVGKFDFDDLPIIKLALYAELEATAFFEIIKNNIQPALARLDGVAQVRILGGQEREIQVNLLNKKLEAFHISIGQVLEAIGRANVELPAGKIKSLDGQVLVRLSGKLTSLEQLRNTKVTTMPDGTIILLKDIADILDTTKERKVLARANGQDAIGLYVTKQSDANAVDVALKIKEAIVRLEKDYESQNLQIELLHDTSVFTIQAADGVFNDLLLAVLLVAMVMFIFLQSVRNALIIMIAVPLSLVGTLGVMYALGFTFNLLTLLGLTLAVGTLVDDAIVVIENIYRHLEMGKSRVRAAYDGTRELGLTLVALTLTLVVVFIPLTLAGGLVSQLLTQFSVTVVVAVLFSLLVACTVVPWLASRFAKVETFDDNPVLKHLVIFFENSLNYLSNLFPTFLAWTLNNKIITYLVTGTMLAASIALVPLGYVGIDFLEAGDRGEFLLQLELPKDATLEQTNQIAKKAELIVKERPEVVSIFTTIGTTNESQAGQSTIHLAELNIELIEKNSRDLSTNIIARQIKNEIESKLIGAKVKPVSINLLGIADRAPVEVYVMGTRPDTLVAFAEKVRDEIAKVQGVVELETSMEGGNPELDIQLDRVKMQSLGLSTAQVAFILRTALTGNTDNQFRDQNSDYDINIRLDAFDRKNKEDLLNLSFLNPKGQRIYLYEFAEIGEKESPSVRNRTSRTPSIFVKGQIVGRPFGDANNEIVERVDQLRLPPDTEILYWGSHKQSSQGFEALIFAGIASILLLYLIMVALYDSFVYPFIILFTIPLAIIGAFLALGLTMEVISLFSITGMMMLVGLVAKNAILVVDFAVELRAKGAELKESLMEATRLRFRPILMTNISMVIGLIPVAIASGAGAEWKNGLAWALIGGLLSSMFLSLIVVPVIYYSMERTLQKLGIDQKKKIEEI